MAISKLKPRHASEGRSIAAALKDRLDYDKNPEKTDGGLLVTGYQCSPDTAWQEFAVSKQIYTATTGRKRAPDQDVISYLIIQSFEPGTITPEDANKLGYKLAMEFTGGEHQFIVATHVDKKHIFSELYSVPDCLQKPYFQIKVQELLLFLYLVDVKKEKQREIYTSPQVEVVKEIHKMLISDLQKRPTIEELSKKYLINTATLKDTFKGIYGQPIGTYMKEYRIKQAAILLRQTQATIAEIANQVGYENQSKFATAFRDVLKIAPAEYRKQNSGD